MEVSRQRAAWPRQAILGLALIAIFWPLNWLLPGNRTAYLFFPLWLGYILLVDGLVLRISQTSLSRRSPKNFALLFLISAPAWWLFEIINDRTQNWEYLGSSNFTYIEYLFLCTLSFSTVMPAVFETAELVSHFNWVQRFASGPHIRPTVRLTLTLFLAGFLLLALTLAWPNWCYPLVWISIALILEALNVWLGRRSFLQHLQHGDWRPVIILPVAALICGFFWEFWNYYSYPKWIYHTPHAHFAHIFEMPLFGYGGYLPFAWELYGLRNLVWPGARQLKI
jgi:hypothetical protein